MTHCDCYDNGLKLYDLIWKHGDDVALLRQKIINHGVQKMSALWYTLLALNCNDSGYESPNKDVETNERIVLAIIGTEYNHLQKELMKK